MLFRGIIEVALMPDTVKHAVQSKANIPRPLLNAGATKPNPKFDRERGDFMLP